ncbi:MAG TPA: FAD-dependent oxidoreductase [Kiloniellales bacterium]|nr:FAD-dependent oxidoreductase [Kiloniellales bacterium]
MSEDLLERRRAAAREREQGGAEPAGDLPRSARVVVIGGGVVGCSLLYHLAKRGWRDCLLLEAKELTSGSTWHAAGNCPNFSGSWSIMKLQHYSTQLYASLAAEVDYPITYHRTGAIRLAQHRERMLEFEHVTDMAQHQGIAFEMLTPAEIRERYPLIETAGLVGGQWDPGDGDIDPAQLTQALAKGARALGAAIRRFCKVTGLRREIGGWVVETARGAVRAEIVVNAAGYRAAEVGAMAGRDIPCVSLSHQYLVTEPVPELARLAGKLPLLRDPDDSYYLRQEGGGLLLGPYERQPRAHWVDEPVPEDFSFQLFADDLDRLTPNIEAAIRRVPALGTAGIKRVVNGPIPYTPDGNPLIGPAPGLTNFFECCVFSFGIVQAGGAGKACAEWIVDGAPSWDLWSLDPRRFTGHATKAYTTVKALELYANEYAIGFPFEERPAGRPAKTSPLYHRLRAEGAQFGARNGWERATWFPRAGEPVEHPHSLTGPGFRDAIAAECRRVAEAVGIVDLPGFSKFRLRGGAVQSFLDRLIAGRLPLVGRTTLAYVCTAKGGLLSEFTITALAPDDYLLIGAGSAEWHDLDVLRHAVQPGEDLTIANVTARFGTLLVTGPEARALLSKVTAADLSSAAFPWLGARRIEIGSAKAIALRVSYVGELGWELHLPVEQLAGVYEALWSCGRDHGLGNVGIYAVDALRLEKAYRSWKQDLEIGYSPLAAGLGRFVDLGKAAFAGREALVREAEQGTAQQFVGLTIDEPGAYLMPLASVFAAGKRAGIVTSAGVGHRVGSSLALAYVAREHAQEGARLEVMHFGKRLGAAVTLQPFYDPANERLRA